MTPHSPLTGLLVGLLDGAIVALVVMTVLVLLGRRHARRAHAALIAPSQPGTAGAPVGATEDTADPDETARRAAHLREVA